MSDDDLARFLADRYDEAEALARAAGEGDEHGGLAWHQYDPERAPGKIVDKHGCTIVYDEGSPTADEAAFIAAVDPAHRLADIALKRTILAEHKHYDEFADSAVSVHFGCELCHWHSEYGIPPGVDWCATVRQLGTEFASHSAYKESWKP